MALRLLSFITVHDGLNESWLLCRKIPLFSNQADFTPGWMCCFSLVGFLMQFWNNIFFFFVCLSHQFLTNTKGQTVHALPQFIGKETLQPMLLTLKSFLLLTLSQELPIRARTFTEPSPVRVGDCFLNVRTLVIHVLSPHFPNSRSYLIKRVYWINKQMLCESAL